MADEIMVEQKKRIMDVIEGWLDKIFVKENILILVILQGLNSYVTEGKESIIRDLNVEINIAKDTNEKLNTELEDILVEIDGYELELVSLSEEKSKLETRVAAISKRESIIKKQNEALNAKYIKVNEELANAKLTEREKGRVLRTSESKDFDTPLPAEPEPVVSATYVADEPPIPGATAGDVPTEEVVLEVENEDPFESEEATSSSPMPSSGEP
jgi:hypothetical protein